MDLDRLVAQFESLGDSCEFGLVQRKAGAEPLGLLRFAGFPGGLQDRLGALISALDRGFEGLGDPDTVNISLEGPPGHQEYMVSETSYGLWYHTFLGPTDVDADKLRKNESIRLRFLRRKLLTDLTAAEKICVWKCNDPVEVAQVERLLAALRRYGPVRLLWVCAVDNTPGPVGRVERLGDGFLRGVIDRFAPYGTMLNIHHEAWIALCTMAVRLLALPVASDDANRTIVPISVRELIERGQSDPSVAGIRGVNVLLPAGSHARSGPVLHDTTYLDPDLREMDRAYHANTPIALDDVLKVVLERALVTGHGAVITQDGYLVRESCWEQLDSRVLPNGLTDRDGQGLRLSTTPKRLVRDPALLLKRPWWRNYRHFLVETAGLLAFVATRLDVTKLQLVVGKEDEPARRDAMHELLAMLAPNARLLEHPDDEVWRFSDLHYVTPVYVPPVRMLPDAVSALRSSALAAVGDAPSDAPRRRLFVMHSAVEQPRLANEAEIIAVCEEFGFDVITPQFQSMTDRIKAFRDAEIVVGVRASQFANIVFCPPSALVIALAPGDWSDPYHAQIASGSGLRYAEIFGQVVETPMQAVPSDFYIDPNKFRDVLKSLLAACGLVPPGTAGDALRDVTPTGDTLNPSTVVAFEAFLPVVSYPDVQGDSILAVLRTLHRTLAPRTYLEIGTQYGKALAIADCQAIAIGPWMMPDPTLIEKRPGLSLFKTTSDAFFAGHDPRHCLGGPIELAFLDGPRYHFDRTLRDFINVERYAAAHSIVLIPAVVPSDIYMACRDWLDDFRRSRSAHPMLWAGDVWKIVGALRTYRPDLTLDILDASPAGLLMVRGLDPASSVLQERYQQIVQDVMGWPSEEEAFAAYRAALPLRTTQDLSALLAERPHASMNATA